MSQLFVSKERAFITQPCHMFLSQVLVISIKLLITVCNVETLAEFGSHISEPDLIYLHE